MEIEFFGYYTKTDFFKAVSLINKPSIKSTLFRIGLVVFFIVILFMNGIKTSNQSEISLKSIWHFIMLPIVIWFLLKPKISAFLTASSLWKDLDLQEPFSGTISIRGISYDLSLDKCLVITWEKFVKKRMNENLIVLLSANGAIFVLSHDFFETENDWQKVRQWVDFKVMEVV